MTRIINIRAKAPNIFWRIVQLVNQCIAIPHRHAIYHYTLQLETGIQAPSFMERNAIIDRPVSFIVDQNDKNLTVLLNLI
jgi:hypothetical protein